MLKCSTSTIKVILNSTTDVWLELLLSKLCDLCATSTGDKVEQKQHWTLWAVFWMITVTVSLVLVQWGSADRGCVPGTATELGSVCRQRSGSRCGCCHHLRSLPGCCPRHWLHLLYHSKKTQRGVFPEDHVEITLNDSHSPERSYKPLSASLSLSSLCGGTVDLLLSALECMFCNITKIKALLKFKVNNNHESRWKEAAGDTRCRGSVCLSTPSTAFSAVNTFLMYDFKRFYFKCEVVNQLSISYKSQGEEREWKQERWWNTSRFFLSAHVQVMDWSYFSFHSLKDKLKLKGASHLLTRLVMR